MPYYPNAQRNRPPETQRNLPKYRFGIPPPLSLYEGYRGQSHMSFSSSTPTGDVWKTTNQASSEFGSVFVVQCFQLFVLIAPGFPAS